MNGDFEKESMMAMVFMVVLLQGEVFASIGANTATGW
jgi:hypothetical protein